jgi:hypothetical protein
MNFKSKHQTIFLDPNVEGSFELKPKEKVNVILSPSLYWVQKVSLPLKYVRDVKKLLPSLFEDILPEGSYSYSAYKSGDDFYIFAYEDKIILNTLTKKGVNVASVAKVYFAQSELGNISQSKRVSKDESLFVKDSLLTMVPTAWVESSQELDLQGITLSNHTVVLQQFGHIVDNKSLYKIAAIMLVISLLLLSEYIITSKKVDDILQAKEELFSKYKLKSTMFQNEAVFKKYNFIHKKQMNLRQVMAVFLALRLKPEEKISILELKNGRLYVLFSGVLKGKEQQIKKVLKDKGVIFKDSFKSGNWHLEVTL